MSNVYDADGTLVNRPGIPTQNGSGLCRYKDANNTVLDWFDTHPRPVEVPVVAEVAPVVVPPVIEVPVVAEPVITQTFPEALIEKAIVNEAAPSNPDVPQV